MLNWFRTVDLGFIDYIELEKVNKTVEAGVYLIMEGRSPTEKGAQNVLTRERFQEMIDFEDFLMNVTYPVPPEIETADIAAGEPPTLITFYELCRKVNVTS